MSLSRLVSRVVAPLAVLGLLVSGSVALAEGASEIGGVVDDPIASDCFNCSKESSGDCAGHQQCKGSRDHCRKIGCKITGTSSCSTAANVKVCSYVAPAPPAAETCFMCGKDSSGDCAGHEQCRGSRDECRKLGCKISGTSSCSTAANVKICEKK